MKIQAKKIIGGGHKGEMAGEIGEVHLQGGDIAGMETLCGNVDTYMDYEEVNEPVTCAACKEIYESIKKSRKRITFEQTHKSVLNY